MTVQQLRERLTPYPDDAHVLVEYDSTVEGNVHLHFIEGQLVLTHGEFGHHPAHHDLGDCVRYYLDHPPYYLEQA